jgi:hypothetical protein
MKDRRQEELTEEAAAMAYARSWNRLEPDEFLALLSPQARYASQWVLEEKTGAADIGVYLRGKMHTVKISGAEDPRWRVHAEMGRAANGRHCVLLTQGGLDIGGVVVFETARGQITRFDMCMPEIMGAARTGVIPL